MASTSASFSHLTILHRFILRRPNPIPSLIHTPTLTFPSKQSLYSSLKTTSYLTPSTHKLFSSPNDVALLNNDNQTTETVTENDSVSVNTNIIKKPNIIRPKSPPPPNLTIKEKKELASYAHSLGKKLKSQQVGKSGITDTVVFALVETLEANELLKLKIHNSCPSEIEEAVKELEEATGSVAVGRIGRTVILYRPSLTKQKAEEKKRENQRIILKRQQMAQSRRAASLSGEETRDFDRGGRRGRSKF